MTKELTNEEHIERCSKIFDHIQNVQEFCFKLAVELIKDSQQRLARQLLKRALSHDLSKFSDLEYYGMYSEDKAIKDLAINNHRSLNPHHIDYHVNLLDMQEVDLAEMACDLRARSVEFGSSVKDYVKDFIEFRKISPNSKFYKSVTKYLNMIIEDKF